jgi:type IV pilus assembly protein PilB
MRDKETAEIAIKLANTGHLTFSTLHTNDAPSAVSRLFKMGIEPFLIAYAINLIVAQRLVRRLCPKCKKRVVNFDEGLMVAAELNIAEWRNLQYMKLQDAMNVMERDIKEDLQYTKPFILQRN